MLLLLEVDNVYKNKVIKDTTCSINAIIIHLFCLMQIRMQAEYRSGTNVVRKGMIRSFMSIFKEEGARGLYRVICKNLLILFT